MSERLESNERESVDADSIDAGTGDVGGPPQPAARRWTPIILLACVVVGLMVFLAVSQTSGGPLRQEVVLDSVVVSRVKNAGPNQVTLVPARAERFVEIVRDAQVTQSVVMDSWLSHWFARFRHGVVMTGGSDAQTAQIPLTSGQHALVLVHESDNELMVIISRAGLGKQTMKPSQWIKEVFVCVAGPDIDELRAIIDEAIDTAPDGESELLDEVEMESDERIEKPAAE